jgi:hypothetical protein
MQSAFPVLAAAAAAVAVAGGCGGSGKQATTSTPATTAATTTRATTTKPAPTTTAPAPGALQAEAASAAAGDIPDNQVFLAFRNGPARYTMKYPEGWAQRGAGRNVTFRDKNNIVRIVVEPGKAPTAAEVRAGVKGASVKSGPQRMTVSGAPAFKIVYSTESAPNLVTGKRVTLVTDRYYLWKGGRRAVVDLGTPMGVDNVDAYRLMIESFRWR